jgi:hypothetical protein
MAATPLSREQQRAKTWQGSGSVGKPRAGATPTPAELLEAPDFSCLLAT